MTTERHNIISFMGNPLTLLGEPKNKGDKAPDFSLVAGDLTSRSLEDYRGKIIFISTVPSLDTGVCDLQTKRLSMELANISPNVKLLTISCDLPFAQSRWKGEASLDTMEILSDHKSLSFGLGYGLAIKELRLLARSLMIINTQGVIVYEQLVREMTKEPDYATALTALKACVKG